MKGNKSFVLMVIGLTVLMSVNAYGQSKRISSIQEEGPLIALQKATLAYQNTNDLNDYFRIAWSKFALGQLSEAEKMCEEALSKKGITEDQISRFLYLKAHVLDRKGLTLDAINNYHLANEYFEKLGKYGNLYNTNMSLAKLYIGVGDFGLASQILDTSYEIADEYQIGLGKHLHLKMLLAFWEEDYWAALRFAERSHAEYVNDRDALGIAAGLNAIGFLRIITGDFDGGQKATQLAKEKIFLIGDQDMHYYSLINTLLYQRCIGQDISMTISQIKTRIEKDEDQDLQRFFDFVLDFDCSTIVKRDENQLPENGFTNGIPDAPEEDDPN